MVYVISTPKTWVHFHKYNFAGRRTFLWIRLSNSLVLRSHLNVGFTFCFSVDLSSICNVQWWRPLFYVPSRGDRDGSLPKSPDPPGCSENGIYILSHGVPAAYVDKITMSSLKQDASLQGWIIKSSPGRETCIWNFPWSTRDGGLNHMTLVFKEIWESFCFIWNRKRRAPKGSQNSCRGWVFLAFGENGGRAWGSEVSCESGLGKTSHWTCTRKLGVTSILLLIWKVFLGVQSL